MGESLVQVLTVEKKMDESVKSGGRLEVSVSFGRFENDALAWEKWSSFSQNKYLEEVGSLSTPGSVAQKKAYFEAHYKKIAAAKKIEELELEKTTNALYPTPDESCSENSSGIDASLGLSNSERLSEENVDTANATGLTNLIIDDVAKECNAKSDQVFESDSCTNGLMESIVSEEKVDEEAIDELKFVVESKLDAREESVLIGVEVLREDSLSIGEKAPEKKNGTGNSHVLEKEKSKLKNTTQKVTPTKKDRNLSAPPKKSIISPVVKSSKAHTPTLRYSKPTPSSTPRTASQSSKRKMNQSPLPNRNIATPTSLHMSLSLGPTKTSAHVPITRKSLIIEQMGDKDIVRRAFKSFQISANGLSTDEISSTVKQVQTTALKSKVSTSSASRKGNEGPRKDVAKVATQRSQSVTRSNPLPSSVNGRPDKSSAPKNTVAVTPSIALRSDERAEKRKEFLKKLEAKSIAREADNAQRSAKSKEEKESEMKKLRESLKFKAKPFPSFYRNQEKRNPEREQTKNEMHH